VDTRENRAPRAPAKPKHCARWVAIPDRIKNFFERNGLRFGGIAIERNARSAHPPLSRGTFVKPGASIRKSGCEMNPPPASRVTVVKTGASLQKKWMRDAPATVPHQSCQIRRKPSEKWMRDVPATVPRHSCQIRRKPSEQWMRDERQVPHPSASEECEMREEGDQRKEEKSGLRFEAIAMATWD